LAWPGPESYKFCPLCGGGLEERLIKASEPKRLVCTRCSYIFYIDPKLAVLALVPYKGGLVMVRRGIEPGYGLWAVPGGFVDVGEKVEEAVVRETREETGLTVKVVRLLKVHSYRHSRTVVLSYLTEYLSGELRVGDEELEVRVFAPEEIPWEQIAFTSTRDAMKEYLGQLKSAQAQNPGNETPMTLAAKKNRLFRLLKEKSFYYRPDQPFRLTSGRESPYYVDCRPVTHSAEGLALMGEVFFDLIKDLDVQGIGGLTMGADPIAHATALVSYQQGKPVNAFSVRKLAKEHGAGGLIVGDVHPGDKVVIVEDVITTGGSTLKAIEAARQFGLEVIKVLILVDREEGGRKAVEASVPEVESIFRMSQLKN